MNAAPNPHQPASQARAAGQAALRALDRALAKLRSAETHSFTAGVTEDAAFGVMADMAVTEANRLTQEAIRAVEAFAEAVARVGIPPPASRPHPSRVTESFLLSVPVYDRRLMALDKEFDCRVVAAALERLRDQVEQTMQALP